jgi:hypothetical protein
MRTVRVGVESRLGAEAVAFFDSLQIGVQLGYPELFTKQRAMLDALELDIPEIAQRQGCEISEEIIHINDFSVGTELPDYDWLAEVGGFLDDQGMLIDELAFRDFVTEYVVDQAHGRDGVAALAHPYGASPDSTGGVDRQVKLDELVALEAWGADAMEVGYRSRGGHDLPDHLWLWDELAKNERFLTGIGVTDAHGPGHVHGPNNFVTWIWADSSSKPDLILGLKRGRAYFGDILLFDGELSASTATGFEMGQIVVTDKSSEEITMQIDGLQGGEEVRTIWDGVLANTYLGSAGSFIQSETLPIGDATSWRVEVWDSGGTAIVFSNPIYFESRVPAAGIGPHRAAVDVGGASTTAVDSWTFTGVLYRDLGSRKLMKINGRGSGGGVVFDFAAIGEPTGIRFEGMTGSWSYEAGVLTLSALEGEGAIKILKRL